MTDLLLNDLFVPPSLNIGERVIRKDLRLHEYRHGTVVSTGGWFTVVKWDGIPKSSREYIPDLEPEIS
jgi:hypothetical protein